MGTKSLFITLILLIGVCLYCADQKIPTLHGEYLKRLKAAGQQEQLTDEVAQPEEGAFDRWSKLLDQVQIERADKNQKEQEE